MYLNSAESSLFWQSHLFVNIFRHADATTGFGKKVFGSGTKVLPDDQIILELIMHVCPHLQSLNEEENESFLEKMLEHVKKKGGPYKMQEHPENKKRKPLKFAKNIKVSEPAGSSGENTTMLIGGFTRRPTPLKKVKLRQTPTNRQKMTSPPSFIKNSQQQVSALPDQFGGPVQVVKPTIIGQLGGGLSDDTAIGDLPRPSASAAAAVKFLAMRATTSSPLAFTTSQPGKPTSEDKDQIRYFYQSLSSPLSVLQRL